MIDLSPEVITGVLFISILVGIFTGFYLAVPIGATAMIVGFLLLGPGTLEIIYARFFHLLTSYTLLACPLFVFMGAMLKNSGVAEKMYDAFYVFLGRIRGGLAIITVILGAILATMVGIVAASVVMLSLIALPIMINRGYDRALAAGSVCAGGILGIFIPPSLMLIIYAEMAGVSAGRMFMGAFLPGFTLAGLYCIYILIRCFLNPKLAPATTEHITMPFIKKITLLATSMLPVGLLILSVLGVIFLGIAPPTEAAACGCLATVLISIGYRRFTWKTLYNSTIETIKLASMVLFIGGMANAFVGIFLALGCGHVVEDLIMGAPGGKWGIFAMIMFAYFILGFVLEWIGIMFIIVPITAPIYASLGFDPIWFGIMVCLNLQAAHMTPPMAQAIFYLRGSAPPELGITMGEIIRGVIPFVFLVLVAIALCTVFPQIVLWLPNQMIR